MIITEKQNDLWVLTLARPQKANSLTGTMLGELVALARAAAVENVKALILTGEGRVFSAGADLDEARAGLAVDPVWEQLSGALSALPCLTIAALNGTLAGGAFGMALACDIRLAVPTAKFFYPVMKLGFLPQPSDPARLTALVGPARAKMILMSGQKIEADEARDWGLIDRIVPEDSLLETARALAADTLGAAPEHLAAIKKMCGGRQ